MWKVNQDGEKIQAIELADQREGKKLNVAYSYIKSIIATEKGDTLLIVEFVEGQPSIVKAGKDGKVLLSKRLTELGSDAVIYKIIPTGEQEFFLMGRKSENAFLVKIDEAGNVLFNKTFDLGRIELFIDGISTDSGGAILTGNFGTLSRDSKFGMEDSHMWILKVDGEGNRQLEKSFPGRFGSVAKTSDGNYVIVYDKSNSMDQDIRVRMMNSELDQLWEIQHLSVGPGFAKFKIVNTPNNEFIIGGSKHSSLWIARIDSQGKEVWNYVDYPMEGTWSVGCNSLISVQREVFILSSIYSENNDRQLNNKVGLIKLIQE